MLPGFTPALSSVANYGNDAYTVLLAHFDGANNSTVMPDSSPKQHGNAAVAGGCYLTAGSPLTGGGACLLNPASGYITFPNSADWEFGAGDFTVDWWEYRNVAAGCAVARDLATTYCPFLLHFGANGEIYMTSTGSSWDIANGAAGLPAPGFGPATLSVWNHFAVTRQGNTFRAFKNGVQKSTWTSSLAIIANANPLCIGAAQNGQNVNSYMDELRISKGIARWTANFTPPNKPYAPDYIGDPLTKLLMHFDSTTTVTDSSPYKRGAATVTGGGIGTTGAQIKFGDGSCVFPGTANTYLSYPDSPDWNIRADKTIECFVRLNALPAASQAFAFVSQVDAPNGNGWSLFVNEGGYPYLQCEVGGTYYFPLGPSGPMALNTWYHIAAVYAGGNVTVYRDGVGGAPVAVPPIPDMPQPLIIGAFGGSPPPYYWMNGYIDELRISDTARWSGNFSPPSAPYNPVTTKGPATHFSVTAPAVVSVNSAFNVTVQALDANGLSTNNYSGTVHFTSTDGAAVLPANTVLSGGVGTFPVTLKTLGSFTVTATDTGTGSINGTSAPISVLAVRNVAISASQANINLRTLHDASFPAPDASTIVVFTLNAGVKISSGGYATPSLNVGSWPAGADLTLSVAGDARGAGGNGGDSGGPNAQPGGTAIYTRVAIKLACTGTIWGGGGGGGGTPFNSLAGSGGAGIIPGPGGFGVGVAGGQAPPGTETAGGAGIAYAGGGGGPGVAGAAASAPSTNWPGGAAGYAIDGVGYVTKGSYSGSVFTPGALGGDVRGTQG